MTFAYSTPGGALTRGMWPSRPMRFPRHGGLAALHYLHDLGFSIGAILKSHQHKDNLLRRVEVTSQSMWPVMTTGHGAWRTT